MIQPKLSRPGRVRWLNLLVCGLLAAGCSSGALHKVDEETFSPENSGHPYRNILVVAVQSDRTSRISTETVLAEELKKQGLNAAPSYDLLPDLETGLDEMTLSEALAGSGRDAVLAIEMLDEGYDYDVGDYMATRGIVYMLGGRPGAGTDIGSMIAWAGSGQYSLSVSLWDAATLKGVWQATTHSSDSGSETDNQKGLVKFIVENLRAKKLI